MKKLIFALVFCTLPLLAQTPAPHATPDVQAATKKQLASLDQIGKKYSSSAMITMKVKKNLKLGLLGQERNSKGQMTLSQGRVRLELEGDEKNLLVINKSDLWLATYPSGDLAEADPKSANVATQVVHGKTSSPQLKNQAFLSLLSNGGFSKRFQTTGVSAVENGWIFFMQPNASAKDSSVKRLELRVSKDFKQILALHFWDDRENETVFNFDDVQFSKKKANDKLFKYSPPASASVMES